MPKNKNLSSYTVLVFCAVLGLSFILGGSVGQAVPSISNEEAAKKRVSEAERNLSFFDSMLGPGPETIMYLKGRPIEKREYRNMLEDELTRAKNHLALLQQEPKESKIQNPLPPRMPEFHPEAAAYFWETVKYNDLLGERYEQIIGLLDSTFVHLQQNLQNVRGRYGNGVGVLGDFVTESKEVSGAVIMRLQSLTTKTPELENYMEFFRRINTLMISPHFQSSQLTFSKIETFQIEALNWYSEMFGQKKSTFIAKFIYEMFFQNGVENYPKYLAAAERANWIYLHIQAPEKADGLSIENITLDEIVANKLQADNLNYLQRAKSCGSIFLK